MTSKKFEWKSRNFSRLLAGFGVLVALIYITFLVTRYWHDISHFMSVEKQVANFGRRFSSANVVNFFVLIALTALGSAVPFLSNAVLAVFNGVVFGPWLALVMNVVANTLGNLLSLRIMRWIKLTDREKHYSDKLAILRKFDNPYLAIILGYMIPVFPTLLVNYLVTEMKFPLKKWLPCVMIGVFPTSCLYAFGGDAIIKGNIKRLAILVVLIIIAYVLVRKLLTHQKASETTD